MTDWLWITPERALNSPEVTLVYATRSVLESVASEVDVERLFSRAALMKDVPIVEPRMVQTEAGWEIER